ncbi:MAG TPA: hypothetical protein VM056_01575 [Terriglobales bacterium]|nr:hypothetical protein [Terriglobales bacterium]
MFGEKKSTRKTNSIYILFLAGYMMMGLLVVEQGKIIDSQRTLIRSLFADNSQLTAITLNPAKR